MKIKEGFELQNVCGENVVLASGVENINFSKIISLNESAALIWNKVVGKEFSEKDIVKILLDEYEVDEQTAQADVVSLVASWKDAGLIA